jgi:hypothetical protein
VRLSDFAVLTAVVGLMIALAGEQPILVSTDRNRL